MVAELERTVTCPECGTLGVVTSGGRAAADFCPSCDYPLFWARESATVSVTTTDEALYRAPGTSGASLASSISCPSCGERNAPVESVCARCSSSLRPAPPAAPAPPPLPVPVVQEVVNVVECDHMPSWAVALIASTATLLVCVLAYWLWG